MEASNCVKLFISRISEENLLIESLLANRSEISRLGRPVHNASGNSDESCL